MGSYMNDTAALAFFSQVLSRGALSKQYLAVGKTRRNRLNLFLNKRSCRVRNPQNQSSAVSRSGPCLTKSVDAGAGCVRHCKFIDQVLAAIKQGMEGQAVQDSMRCHH